MLGNGQIYLKWEGEPQRGEQEKRKREKDNRRGKNGNKDFV